MYPLRPSCLITDEIAFVLLIGVVYFQVCYIMRLYHVKFREELDHRDHKLKRMNLENENALEKCMSDFASATQRIQPLEERIQPLEERIQPLEERIQPLEERIQPLEERIETLEGVLKGLISAETSVLKSSTTRLRALIDSGTHWPNKKQKLEAELDEAAQREAAWQKAASWA